MKKSTLEMKPKTKQDLTKHGELPREGTQEFAHTPSWNWVFRSFKS